MLSTKTKALSSTTTTTRLSCSHLKPGIILNHNQAFMFSTKTRLYPKPHPGQSITLSTTTRPYALSNQPDFKQLHSQPQWVLMLCPINQISRNYTLKHNQALCSVESTRLQAITLPTTTRPYALSNQPDFKQLHSQPQPGLFHCYAVNNKTLSSLQSIRIDYFLCAFMKHILYMFVLLS